MAAARAGGVGTMYTLSGAHVFPLYDAAVTCDPPMRLVDVRHEQSAVFAAEAEAKISRQPGLAVVTAGPGVTNSVSAVAQASGSGVPLLLLGGRAPAGRWGQGALQELDHPPLLAPVTKFAGTAESPDSVPTAVTEALRVASAPRRGPTFLDVPMDVLFSHADAEVSAPPTIAPPSPTSGDVDRVAELLAQARRPVLVLGSAVWMGRAEDAALSFAERTGTPVVLQGMGRGILPPEHPLLATKARSLALSEADLVLVVGAPLDFRLGYGRFGPEDDRAAVVQLVESPEEVARHADLAATATGDLTAALAAVADAWESVLSVTGSPQAAAGAQREEWRRRLADRVSEAERADHGLMASDPPGGIHPARVYADLQRAMPSDGIVIGDGGDFVSWAGKFVQPARPGRWLDPGPYGCLGAGLGAAIGAAVADPASTTTLLLGDGAAGMSLMDADTLVRHQLPVVMVLGNNGAWGLEKFPMRFLYGYDVAAELRQDTRYDRVVEALGGAGETVSAAADLPAALRRAYDSGVPYLVNVLLDPDASYPRKTTGV